MRQSIKQFKNIYFSKFSRVICPKKPLTEIWGFHRILIENYCKIIDYQENLIEIAVSVGSIVISGQQMQILQITSEKLIITGSIENVSMIRKKG